MKCETSVLALANSGEATPSLVRLLLPKGTFRSTCQDLE